MGVPALFRWLSNKYSKIISPVIEEQPYEVGEEVIPVDTTKPNPNGEELDNLYLDMNGIVHNCTHPDGHPAPETEPDMMLEIFKYTDRVVNMVRPRKLLLIAVDGVAPRAKMNQQRARRFRSAQEAKETDEKREEFRKLLEKQPSSRQDAEIEEHVIKKTWDSNVITPGTPFMDLLAASLRYWIAYKLNTDPAWEKLKIIISDATVPGEGEHKIMEFVRSQRSSPEHDPNTRHVMYGLDADLIMLGLATHEPHFRVLREDVFFQESKARTCRLCGQTGHKAEECRGQAKQKNGDFDEKHQATSQKPFIWLHVSVLREYLAAELHVPQQPFPFDLERALDDWVFMCFFVGNDFLPHLPSLDIRENGIETLLAIWRDNIPLMDGYVTKDGIVNFKHAQLILTGLAKQEDAIFRRRRQTEERKRANELRRKDEEKMRNEERDRKRRRSSPTYGSPTNSRPHGRGGDLAAPVDLPLITPGRGELSRETRELTHTMVVNRGAIYKANVANKSAAAVLKSQLLKGSQGEPGSVEETGSSNEESIASMKASSSILGKRKAELTDEHENNDTSTPSIETPVGAETRKNDEEEPPDSVRLWEEGYADRYYEQKFHVDLKDHDFRHKVARAYAEGLQWVLLYYFQGCPSWTWYYPYHYAPFAADFVDIGDMSVSFDKGKPFKPFEQLMGVLPAASNHAIPEIFHDLMVNPSSEIIDFYPEEFPIDLNGKKFAWQGVVLLPFIDEKRLLAAMEKKYDLLTVDEKLRNTMGKDVLLISDRHPLYNDVATNFYSKKQGTPKFTLSVRRSEGLAGVVERNDNCIPHGALRAPFEDDELLGLDEDHSMLVNYEMPKSAHMHKSMVLRGVIFNSPTLDQADIQQVKAKAQNSGRSYGGAPLRNNSNGRGGRMNYSGHRSNPFAAHLDPAFIPHFQNGTPGPPPGWVPPPQGSAPYAQGPPPPHRGSGNHQHYLPSSQYGPPPRQSYQGAYPNSEFHGQSGDHGRQYPSHNNPPQQYNQRDYHDNHHGGSNYQDRRGNSDYRANYNDYSRQGRGSHNGGHSNGYGRY